MHRDIKPPNIAIHPETKKVTIIDWGLGEYYIPNKTYGPRTGTLRYKAPEQLLGYVYLDYAIDIWAVGCSFASMVRLPQKMSNNNRFLINIHFILERIIFINLGR